MLSGAGKERRNRIVALILRYGWHGLSALQYMIEDDDRQAVYSDYTATMQRHLVNLLGRYMIGEEWEDVPSFIEMIHDSKLTVQPQQTNEDAKSHVYSIFGVSPPERG